MKCIAQTIMRCLHILILLVFVGNLSASESPKQFICTFDSLQKRLVAIRDTDTLICADGCSFVRMNDSLIQLKSPVVLDSTQVRVPRSVATLIGRRIVVTTDSLTSPDTLLPAVKKPVVLEVKKQRAGKFTSSIIRTIVIDPGHGGKDPGAIGPGNVREKDVVLGTGLFLRDALKKQLDIACYLTRDDDTFIPLNKRTKFANEKKADLFLSIHANSVPKSKRATTRGFKIYFLSQAKNEDDKLTAMIENEVIEFEEASDKGSYLQNVLIDLAGNEHLTESQDISITLSETFENKLKKVPKLHKGVGQANFYVLNGAYMPAVLIEIGFISHPDEVKVIASKEGQMEIAEGIADAVVNFVKKYEAQNE